ncbi:MAG: lipocalin-like domain-containing protein [Deinococcales bacterium]
MLLSACVPNVYDAPYPIDSISLPRDEAAHAAPTEWWYYTGHLIGDDGQEYGFEVTFFKTYTPPQYRILGFLPAFWFIDKGFVGHMAISLKDKAQHLKHEIMAFGNKPAGAREDKLDIFIEDWQAKALDDGSYLLKANSPEAQLSLILKPQKAVVLHQSEGFPPGIESMGAAGQSYYFSYTNMEAEGSLKLCQGDCQEIKVNGQAWHDHQWGDFDLNKIAGWDWFSLQLSDNTELMLYLIREPSGAYSDMGGSFVAANGDVSHLSQTDINLITPGITWQSESTGAIYPMAWQIQIPSHELDISVTPRFFAQEMDTRYSTGIVYWEGAVDVGGSHKGAGYVELTNYDLYPYGQTNESTPLQGLRGPSGRR